MPWLSSRPLMRLTWRTRSFVNALRSREMRRRSSSSGVGTRSIAQTARFAPLVGEQRAHQCLTVDLVGLTAKALDVAGRQRIVRLLVKDILVDDDTIVI